MVALSQEVLRSQAPVQASLQVLHELGDQLKQQVDTSAASAIQSDHLSLTQRLSAVEQALTRQLTTLQVEKKKLMLNKTPSCPACWNLFYTYSHFFSSPDWSSRLWNL